MPDEDPLLNCHRNGRGGEQHNDGIDLPEIGHGVYSFPFLPLWRCRMRRISSTLSVLACTGTLVACTHEVPTTTRTPGAPRFSAVSNGASINAVNVSRDTTAQNETPLAFNPVNPANLITGNNDWNYNDGCGVNATFDGGKTWTPTLPNGHIPDHESIHVALDGTIYVPWAHFDGFSSHSPIFIGVSHDGGASFDIPVRVTSGSVHSDQDARVVTDPATSYAYLTFDNSIQGGKGTAMFVSVSKDRGASWSAPVRLATFQNPVCVFPPYCFNISGAPFRGPGSYPVPAFDPTTG